jgi:hypothetical protein
LDRSKPPLSAVFRRTGPCPAPDSPLKDLEPPEDAMLDLTYTSPKPKVIAGARED